MLSRWWYIAGLASLPLTLLSAEPVLAPDVRAIPGDPAPTPWLRYVNPAATSVVAAGSWDLWTNRFALTQEAGRWSLNIEALALALGRHEYKFIVNGEWEAGDNRKLYVNAEHLLQRPPDVIHQAFIQDFRTIDVFLKKGVQDASALHVWLEPAGEIAEWHLESGAESGRLQGYTILADVITFRLDERTYGLDIPPSARVVAAGNFSGWNGTDQRWSLRDDDNNNVWELTTQLQALRKPAGDKDLLFKFVVDGNRWLAPPADALTGVSDGKGNTNLRIDPAMTGSTSIRITTAQDIDLSSACYVAIDGLADQTARQTITPGGVFELLHSDKALGVRLDKEQAATTYRLFAPRAKSVHLCMFDTPEFEKHKPAHQRMTPVERYAMWRDPADGVWEVSLLGLDIGRYYSFNIDGPMGDGEGFAPMACVGDPYALAAAHAENNTIVIDPEATNIWFAGWSDAGYTAPEFQDMVIYEAHIRDLTVHPSSGVPAGLNGRYAGIIASEGTGTGLDHLKDLGINMIEFLPSNEFNNGTEDEYNWGYSTVYFFAPEASYGRQPLKGSQFYEFKSMVNELHRRGFGVILDVVFNHVGYPNLFSLIDKKYFFRLNPDWSYSNFSGVGNDVRTEAPMMRRFIVDNILYWIREHHVDGFRFDLAELIDMKTMLAIRDAVREEHPEIILISEPWSFRGENKHELKGTGWSAWNNDFRYAAKDFAMGRRNRDWMMKNIRGSVETWAANPLQPINYLESHDDMALADELCTRPDRDGRALQPMDVDVNRLAATALFTSLGIPMISEGQEFIRSKWGIHNTYDKGDDVNALRWDERERPAAAEALAYYRGLIRLRTSPAGAAFRVRERPPESYHRWIMPANDQALGYIVNAGHVHEGAAFVVLLNSSGENVTFQVPFPEGRFRMIGNGKTIDPQGIADAQVVQGPAEAGITVPGLHSAIFMDGF